MTIALFLDKARAAAEQTDIEEVFVFDQAEGAIPYASLLQSDAQVPEVDIDPRQDLLVLPYSSGTTGLPKGVMLTHRNILANMVQVEGLADFELVGPEDTLVGVLPFFHIYGMVVILNMSLATGATIVTMPRFDLEQFLQLVQEYRATRVNLVPPIILALAKHPLVDQYDVSLLTVLTSGAAPLGADLAQAGGEGDGWTPRKICFIIPCTPRSVCTMLAADGWA